jgi:hypothetical protein
MEEKTLLKNPHSWAVLLIILATILLSVATYNRWLQLHFLVGPFYFHHWGGWVGTVFIGAFTPAYYFLKRRYPKRFKTLLHIHMFGNLISFIFISIHFAQQVGRPPDFFPDLGTGLALYIVVSILVATGILQRFEIARSLGRYWRSTHVGVTMSFYIIIVIHLLHGLEIK